MPIAYVHNQSMFLKTSGLNHKWFMLHCLVFKEQLCLSKLSLQATHLLYRISFRLSRTFLFFFFVWKEAVPHSASVSNQGTLSCFRAGRYLAATCIILQELHPFVNSNLDFFSRFFQLCKTLPIDTKKASLARCSSSYGRGSWTRTNACGIQRPVPYQLGDTPVSSANRCQRKLLYRIPVVLASTFFLFFENLVQKNASRPSHAFGYAII